MFDIQSILTRYRRVGLCGLMLVSTGLWARAQEASVRIGSLKGSIQLLRAGALTPVTVSNLADGVTLRPGDRVQVGEQSRIFLRWYDQSIIELDERTMFTVQPPPSENKRGILNLLEGAMYFFHRDDPGQIDTRTPTATAAIRGTEFALVVEEDGRTVLTVFDGEVELANEQGRVMLRDDEQGIIDPGSAPAKAPVLEAIHEIQWMLYYPGVLDPAELDLPDAARAALAESIAAYRRGNLFQAARLYPSTRQPAGDAERIYLAALRIGLGRIEQAEGLLEVVLAGDSDRHRRLARALGRMMATVKRLPHEDPSYDLKYATEWLVTSYIEQARAQLPEALAAAEKAAQVASDFGFAHVRVAELQFSFARAEPAIAALDRGLALSPENAQARVLLGFLSAARNRIAEAEGHFQEAIELDPGLGNGWLGRGLARIRQGQIREGQADLLAAAALEPQRALLRSYLSKAYSMVGKTARALEEVELAKALDPGDPTAWLYSALLHQQGNRINQAVRDLEQSQAMNENRRIFRSRLLLDQDRAVRGANLANVYRDAGMLEVSVREAARAVENDYANYSAHWFLANSFNQLRDPNQTELRFETPWLSEYLIANLLAPVGAGILSQTVSQQEYSRLFEQNGLGFVSSTEYLSRGDWSQAAAQYGRQDNLSYAVEVNYGERNGQRINNDFEQVTLSGQFKQQLTPDDSVFLQAIYYNAEGGDLGQLFDRSTANPGLRFKERQEPFLIGGYHHEWGPGSHTLLLGGWINDTLLVNNPRQTTLLTNAAPLGNLFPIVTPITMELDYRNDVDILTSEAQQIWQVPEHTLVVGGRAQYGEFDTEAVQSNPSNFAFFFPGGSTRQDVDNDFWRLSAYGYYHWQPWDPLILTAGVAYDRLRHPVNFLNAPVVEEEAIEDQVSPKAGVRWSPDEKTSVRGTYTRSLGGVSFDQSFRLEPTQIAGFNQAFRSLIPESVQGTIPAAEFETWGAGVDRRLDTGTYLGVEGVLLESDARREAGIYSVNSASPATTTAAGLEQDLEYEEKTLLVNVNQLLAEEWTFGVRYRLSEAELDESFRQLRGIPGAAVETRSVLHQLHTFVLFHHPCGFFSSAEALWSQQSNHGYNPDRPGDEFWQFNVFAGYRLFQRRAEIRLGILNLTDQDYQLSPLNLTPELPRDRTFAARFRVNF